MGRWIASVWLGLALVVWFDASDTLRRGFWLMIAIVRMWTS